MELKKKPQIDLESKRGIFIQIGLVISLTFVLFAFEWKSYNDEILDYSTMSGPAIEEEYIPITRQEMPLPPPPPKVQQTTILNIVKDNVIIKEELNIDAEVTNNTEIFEQGIVDTKGEEPFLEEDIFLVVENPASFPGGEAARAKFIQDNTRYPKMASEKGIQGTVYVTFIVEPNGTLSGLKVLKGIGGGCDEEAMRIVSMMPKWQPGRQRDKTVRVQINMPIRFVLQ